ncbi:MAG: hypothetical protein REI12_05360 [Pedobacter sp.]|nr:hypothetical protein [Pedobacter sp.]
MAWNQPEQKPSGNAGALLLQKLNCFEGDRFHPLRFSVLLAVLLLTVLVVHEVSAAQPSSLRALLDASAGSKK